MCHEPAAGQKKTALGDAFEDLSARFILNCPAEEFQSFERLFFQLEQAHWFYEDFLREQNPSLPGFKLQAFGHQFFEHCPLLHRYRKSFDEKYDQFVSYKVSIPVYGAVMLSDSCSRCVLVKGWSQRSGWYSPDRYRSLCCIWLLGLPTHPSAAQILLPARRGFPKGKINKDEAALDCAVREVQEETGFDCRPYIRSEEDVLTLRVASQSINLYVARGVPESTAFVTQTRKEIREIAWFDLDEIPHNNQFYMVAPFVPLLRKWIKRSRKQSSSSPDLLTLLGISPSRAMTSASHGAEVRGSGNSLSLKVSRSEWAKNLAAAASPNGESCMRANERCSGSGLTLDGKFATLPKQRSRSDGSLLHLLRPEAAAAHSHASEGSLLHLLRPPEAAAAHASLSSTNRATVQLHEWAKWNTIEMQRMQAHALGSTHADRVSFPLPPRSASLPCTPELKSHPRHATPSPLALPAAYVESVEAAAAQSTSVGLGTSIEDAGFHFDKGDILGTLRF